MWIWTVQVALAGATFSFSADGQDLGSWWVDDPLGQPHAIVVDAPNDERYQIRPRVLAWDDHTVVLEATISRTIWDRQGRTSLRVVSRPRIHAQFGEEASVTIGEEVQVRTQNIGEVGYFDRVFEGFTFAARVDAIEEDFVVDEIIAVVPTDRPDAVVLVPPAFDTTRDVACDGEVTATWTAGVGNTLGLTVSPAGRVRPGTTFEATCTVPGIVLVDELDLPVRLLVE